MRSPFGNLPGALVLMRLTIALLCAASVFALERPGTEFKIFQFPADAIPRIDADASDWDIVPDSYAIGADQLRDAVVNIGAKPDPANLDVTVKVGWVKGMKQTVLPLRGL